MCFRKTLRAGTPSRFTGTNGVIHVRTIPSSIAARQKTGVMTPSMGAGRTRSGRVRKGSSFNGSEKEKESIRKAPDPAPEMCFCHAGAGEKKRRIHAGNRPLPEQRGKEEKTLFPENGNPQRIFPSSLLLRRGNQRSSQYKFRLCIPPPGRIPSCWRIQRSTIGSRMKSSRSSLISKR